MNFTNDTFEIDLYLTKNEWFDQIGSTLTKEIMCLFITTPVSVLGFIFNIVAYAILSKKIFDKIDFYSYMRMYTLNSIVVNFLSAFLFTANSNHFFDFSYASPIPSYYLSYVYIPMINLCMFFTILIEIVISIERINSLNRFSHFLLKFKEITKHKPRNVGVCILVGCAVINVQYFFNEEPTHADLSLNSTTILRMHYIETSYFSLSLFGTILNFCTYFIRDVVLLIIQCILAIISIYLIKKYFKKKKNMITNPSVSTTNRETVYSEVSSLSASRISNRVQSNVLLIYENIAKADRNMTIMIVIMGLLSVLEHCLFITFVVLLNFFRSDTAYLLVMFGDLFISFKHFLNFFLLYLFNRLFRKELKKTLRISNGSVDF